MSQAQKAQHQQCQNNVEELIFVVDDPVRDMISGPMRVGAIVELPVRSFMLRGPVEPVDLIAALDENLEPGTSVVLYIPADAAAETVELLPRRSRHLAEQGGVLYVVSPPGQTMGAFKAAGIRGADEQLLGPVDTAGNG